jgi:hypothetical protein
VTRNPGDVASLSLADARCPSHPLRREASGVHPRDVAGDPPQLLAVGAKYQLVDEPEAEAQRRERSRGRLEIGGCPAATPVSPR